MPRVLAHVLTIAAATLLLGCGDNDRASGEIVIATTFAPADNCPSIAWAVAAPARTSVGGIISVAAAATDPDPDDVLGYTWSPPDGIAKSTSAATTYTCTSAGPKTLSLAVSDHHRPNPCSTSTTLQINCVGGGSTPEP